MGKQKLTLGISKEMIGLSIRLTEVTKLLHWLFLLKVFFSSYYSGHEMDIRERRMAAIVRWCGLS